MIPVRYSLLNARSVSVFFRNCHVIRFNDFDARVSARHFFHPKIAATMFSSSAVKNQFVNQFIKVFLKKTFSFQIGIFSGFCGFVLTRKKDQKRLQIWRQILKLARCAGSSVVSGYPVFTGAGDSPLVGLPVTTSALPVFLQVLL